MLKSSKIIKIKKKATKKNFVSKTDEKNNTNLLSKKTMKKQKSTKIFLEVPQL